MLLLCCLVSRIITGCPAHYSLITDCPTMHMLITGLLQTALQCICSLQPYYRLPYTVYAHYSLITDCLTMHMLITGLLQTALQCICSLQPYYRLPYTVYAHYSLITDCPTMHMLNTGLLQTALYTLCTKGCGELTNIDLKTPMMGSALPNSNQDLSSDGIVPFPSSCGAIDTQLTTKTAVAPSVAQSKEACPFQWT